MIPFGRDKMSRLAGIPVRLETLHKLHPAKVVLSLDERKQVSQKALRGEPNSSTGAISSF